MGNGSRNVAKTRAPLVRCVSTPENDDENYCTFSKI